MEVVTYNMVGDNMDGFDLVEYDMDIILMTWIVVTYPEDVFWGWLLTPKQICGDIACTVFLRQRSSFWHGRPERQKTHHEPWSSWPSVSLQEAAADLHPRPGHLCHLYREYLQLQMSHWNWPCSARSCSCWSTKTRAHVTQCTSWLDRDCQEDEESEVCLGGVT